MLKYELKFRKINMDNTTQKKGLDWERVSSKRQKDEGVSLEAQKKVIKDYCLKNGIEIVKTFEVDESAKNNDRKIFLEMVTYLKQNSDVKYLICEKTDRLLRGNLKDRVLIEELINDYDKEIHCVKEGLILGKETKSAQKLHFDIQNALARHFLNNLSDEVKKGYDILVSDGFYPHIPPIGYLSKLEDHLAIIDPVRVPFIKRAFELCATGENSEKEIGEILYKEGFRGKSGKRVKKSAIAKLLHNPFYYGYFGWQGELHRGNHEAIITKDLFDKVQEVLNPNKKRGYKYDFSYIGLMRCGECGNGITAEVQRGHTYYHCTKPKGAKFCSQKYIREETVAEQLKAIVKDVALSVKQIGTIKEIMRVSLKDESEYLEESLEALNVRYTGLKEQDSRLLDLHLAGKVGGELYDKKSKEITGEIEEVNGEIIKHKNADRAYFQEIESFLIFCNEAPKLFASSRPALQRELLRFVVSNVSVRDKKVEYTLKTPFDLVAKYSQSENWQGWKESNFRFRFWRPKSYH